MTQFRHSWIPDMRLKVGGPPADAASMTARLTWPPSGGMIRPRKRSRSPSRSTSKFLIDDGFTGGA